MGLGYFLAIIWLKVIRLKSYKGGVYGCLGSTTYI